MLLFLWLDGAKTQAKEDQSVGLVFADVTLLQQFDHFEMFVRDSYS